MEKTEEKSLTDQINGTKLENNGQNFKQKSLSDFFSSFFKRQERNETSNQNISEPFTSNPNQENANESIKSTTVDQTNFAWIENEAILRDEGVLFGLSGSKIEEKLNAIKEYYSRKAEVSRSRIDQEKNKIERNIKELGNIDIAIKEIEQKAKDIVGKAQIFKPTFILRNLISLIFILSGGAGSFMIVNHYLADDYGWIASLGVFLFGLFAQFKPLSQWLKHEDGEDSNKWQVIKTTLLEIGTTCSVTMFVGYHVYSQDELIGKSFIVSFFLFFLFLFCGRLVLAFVNNVTAEIKEISLRRKLKKEADIVKKELDLEIFRNKSKHESLQSEIDFANKQIDTEEGNIMEHTGLSKTKVEIFISEYNLAKNFKETVSTDN